MPKDIKAVPPQQSSLKEMWGGKRPQKDTANEDALSNAQGERMEMDDAKPETSMILVLGADNEWRLESAKREDSPAGSEEMDVDQPILQKSAHYSSFSERSND